MLKKEWSRFAFAAIAVALAGVAWPGGWCSAGEGSAADAWQDVSQLLAKGMTSTSLDAFAAAKARLKEIASTAQSRDDRRKAWTTLVNTAFYEGRRDEAKDFLGQLIKFCDEKAASDEDKTVRGWAEEQLAQADELSDKGLVEWLARVSGKLREARQYEQMAAAARDAIPRAQSREARHAACWRLADAAMLAKDYAAVRDAVTDVLEEPLDDREEARAEEYLARILADPAESVAAFRKLINDTRPGDDPGRYYVALGLSLEKMKKPDEAAATYREYLLKHPSGEHSVRAKVRLGVVMLKTNPEQTLGIFVDALNHAGLDSLQYRTAMLYQCTTLMKLQRYAELTQVGEQLMRRFPECAEARAAYTQLKMLSQTPGEGGVYDVVFNPDVRDLVDLFRKSSKPQETKKNVLEFLERNPTLSIAADALVGAMWLLESRKRYADVHEFGGVLGKRCGDKSARAAEARWLVAKAFYEQHDYAKAAAEFTAYLARPDAIPALSGKAHVLLGVSLTHVEDFDGAKKHLTAAAQCAIPDVAASAKRLLKQMETK